MLVIKRNGKAVAFEETKIAVAVQKAFLKDAEGNPRDGISEQATSIKEKVKKITAMAIEALLRHGNDGTVSIEDIQDQVELALMRSGEHKVARDYVLFREARAAERAKQKRGADAQDPATMEVIGEDGQKSTVLLVDLLDTITPYCVDIDGHSVDPQPIVSGIQRLVYDQMPRSEYYQAWILATRPLIERDYRYGYVAARFLLDKVRREALGKTVTQQEMQDEYAGYFQDYVDEGIRYGRLDPRLREFDLQKIGAALRADRDWKFQYQGMQILYDRYLLHEQGRHYELPQALWMRVAMGLALNEVDREKWALQFYDVLSTFRFVSSTPTLFNAGTTHAQLSSCFLTTVPDDLEGIYDAIKENALLSKFSGGLGNDWTPVRSLGSYIKGTNGKSQGVIPFLKVVNDTAVAVNQGGKRKGAVCAYLETWHLDIEEFLELRKNTGDDRRRTHDMNTANWIPDLFMERMEANADWTLFSPSDVPDLHDLYGQAFKERYEQYEKLADEGRITLYKRVKAVELWRKMLTMLFETGHPWITFKDPCNLRSPQQHVGVVHSSNLCTEITLNSSKDETAVCNLGSINLVSHLVKNPVTASSGDEQFTEDWSQESLREELEGLDVLQHLDGEAIRETVQTAMRMLDNVIDINFYATRKARNANIRHRAVGLGVMGFADALQVLRIPMDSPAAVQFADTSQEIISYWAINTSAELARERGSYASFSGSLWSRGILPVDSMKLVDANRDVSTWNRDMVLDPGAWETLREKVKLGMRNSNCMAIAPTATISNIVGVSQGIDPIYQNLYVKSNLSGEFTVVNQNLIDDLERIEVWDEVMVNDLKYFDGSVQQIDRIPSWAKRLYATAFEIDPTWLVKMTAARQKWIDQAVSLNLYLAAPSGRKIDELYRLAWKCGLKTTYYLRTMGATSAEKSTVQTGTLNAVPLAPEAPKACFITDPECEACQ